MKKLIHSLFFLLSWNIAIGQWSQVGPTVASFSQHSTITGNGGTPYVAYSNVLGNPSNAINVKEYDGSNWVSVGSADFSSGSASLPSLVFDNSGTLFIAYLDNGTGVNVKEFDGTNWVSVGAANFAFATSLDLAFDGSTPYVAYSSSSNGKMSVEQYNGTNWVNVGSVGFSGSGADYAQIAFDNSTPYVAFQDFNTSNNAVTVMEFNGSSWVNLGSAGFSAGSAQYVSLAFDSSTPYVAYKDGSESGKASVMSYNGSSWSNVGPAGFSPGLVQYTSLAFHSGTAYLAYSDDSNSDLTRVDYFNGSSWSQLGSNMGTGLCSYVTLSIPGNTAYVVYVDGSNSTSVTVEEYVLSASSCSITASGLANIQCNDNGTTNDPTDDYITFDLDPTGTDLGTSYTVSGTTLTPSGGNYGSVTSFQTSPGTAGGNNIALSIIDGTDPFCTFAFTLTNPGSCSPDCNLNSSGLTNIQCNDNGTVSDPSDDYITFDLDPQGNNLGTTYDVTGATLTPSSGTYGMVTSFQTNPGTAGGGSLNLTIEDGDDAMCTLSFTVNDPGTCSSTCTITASGLANIQCDDNGTTSDPTDDFITFELDPTGLNLGMDYNVTGATLTPNNANYGSATTFSSSSGTAGDGDLNLTIEDGDDSNCTFAVTVADPDDCSPDCEITSSGLSNIQCNNNGTPSDDSDDYITFELDPSGFNLGASYLVSGTILTPTSGAYGSSTTFQTDPGTAGDGDLNLTITDSADGACTFDFIVADPDTCSPDCEITGSGLANILCNNNGTPSDPTDDYITFDLDPSGFNLGASYTVSGTTLTPSTANYGSATSFQTNPGTAGAGDIDLTITDSDDGACTFDVTLTDPDTCSPDCEITSSGLANVTCNNNGTPTDPTDDYITFDLDPSGFNLGASYTVTGTTLTPASANYGSATTFQTNPGTAGAGDLSITITDSDDSGCTLAETVTDPGTCSSDCEITGAGLSNIQCNNNGTPSNPTDDYITFELNPTGNNLGATYSVSGTVLTPSSASYGGSTTFQTNPGTAGAGEIDLTITDSDDGACTFDVTLSDPDTCSPDCEINSSGLANILCNNNGTPSDPTDDYFTFELDPSGFNLGASYSVSGATLTPGSANYGSATTFQTDPGTAGGGDLSITLTDSDDGGCTYSEIVTDPGTCSPDCELTASGLANIQCNNNGTPSDPTDDYITFELDPTGFNLGASYSVSGTSLTPSSANYGSATTFQTNQGTAGAGNIDLTITDSDDGACTFDVTLTDPGSCSPDCELLSSGLSNIACNDNGTPTDPSDDYITFDLNPTGNNLGASYTVTGIPLTPSNASYGAATSFQTNPGTAGGGNLSITLTDSDDGGCTLSETVTDPSTCSNNCSINSAGLTNIQCHDNGTSNDPTDDYITFELDPTGNNLGATYNVTGTTLTPSSANYGVSTTFQTSPGTAGAGDIDLTITDGNNSGCTLMFTLTDPGTCSPDCNLTASGLSNIACNDNGTPSDPTDDYITFDLDPSGYNLGATYSVSGTTVTPSSASYGSATSFQTSPGTAGAGDIDLTITDSDDGACTLVFTLTDPGNCSGDCNLSSSGLANIQCHDNGTPSDPSDDYIIFELDPTGTNLGAGYSVSGVTLTPSSANYGVVTTFQTNPGTAGAGDLNITITDDDDGACTLSETVTDPGTCSTSCEITASGLANIQCNNNGTPSDPTDDYITFELDPTGNNLGAFYTVSGTTLTPSSANYGSAATFQTSPGTAGAGDISLTITDSDDGACTFDFTLSDPNTCSPNCEITASGLANITCNDNGTPSDPTDDFITFELDPDGFNLGASYTVSGTTLTPGSASYGSATSFQTNPGTAGAGDISLTITDSDDGACTFDFTLTDPDTCSPNCEITASGLANITCNDNGTPSDPTDDFITFELDPDGFNLGASYTVSGTTLTPGSASYGSATSFQTNPGTAGAGDISLTITDNDDGACTFDFTLTDPDTCSPNCEITASGLANITCNDNGTPSDPTDDFITFELDPDGFNLGASYTVSGTTLTPGSASYGSATSFQTNPGTAGAGDISLTITDSDDGACTFDFTLTDPDTCSPNCEITASGLANITCNDNGTPSDPTDDFITFELDPDGFNLGASYSVSGTALTPGSASYGSATSFQTNPGTAGAGDISLTITDSDDGACTFDFTLTDPDTCSPNCEITASGLANITCNDNGTPSDPTDDFITFELDPDGFNLGASYTVSGTTLTPGSASYGSATSFQTNPGTAGAGDISLTITDSDDSACTFDFTLTDPDTCSPNCEITASGLANITCNDNGTPSDPTDDFITFELDPDGFNLGASYTVSGTTLTPGSASYGSATSFQTNPGTAGAGDISLTITDSDDGACTFDFTLTDPDTCSPNCEITASGLANITCNDNGTPSDPTDDFITFELDPDGFNLGASYSVSGTVLIPSSANYGAPTTFTTNPGTAGAGDIDLTITDSDDGACTFDFTLTDPGSCSPNCILLTAGLTNIQCNDNGTPGDSSDDYITFVLDPTGYNLAIGYSVSGTTLTPSAANYGSGTSFQTAPGTAGGGDIDLTITDDDDGACTLMVTLTDPGTCSNNCTITSSGLSNIQCNNNGTPSDPTDDYITFDLNPVGNNNSATYLVTGTTLTPSGGNFGVVTNFQTEAGTAGMGDLDLTISDGNNSACSLEITVTDPGTCSPDCGITGSGISNIQCNDNGTPSDPSDDYITFDLDPTGNNLGTSYTVSGTNLNPSGGNYESITSFQTDLGIAGNGDIDLTITDGDDSNCTLTFTLTDPGSCSPNCEITSEGLSNIQCNDNGTPSDASDDYITFELNPTGFNLGASYTVSGAILTPGSANYGSSTLFQTNPGTAGTGNLNLTITDDATGSCTISFVVTDPGDCSPNCEITTNGLANVMCNDNGTPSDPSDDYITFDLDPTGFNLGATYSVSGTTLTPASANYGSVTNFQTSPGTAGDGNIDLTLTDSDDGACTFDFTIIDPETCSPNCEITSAGLTNVQCNDNGTPGNPIDDYITFDLNPTGFNLGLSYTVSGTNLTPSTGDYGVVTSFQTNLGFAGLGDLDLTITDGSDSACTLDFTVTDPGSCSPNCEITTEGLGTIQCHDNGTPGDPLDDFITFTLNPAGFNLSNGYTVSGAVLTPSGGNYGAATLFDTEPGTAGSGNIDLIITDNGDNSCTFNFTLIDPGNCSNNCTISSSGLSNIQCDDNGTPSDPTDDFITFDLNPSGNNTGVNYLVSGTTLNPSGGNYGSVTSFETQPGTAGGGDIDLTITDGNNSACSLTFTLTDPGSCSPDCEILTSGLANILCDDNGSPNDPTDDIITFELDPSGFNTGSSYTVTGAAIIPPGANYGSVSLFQTVAGLAGMGDLTLTIVDDGDNGCTYDIVVADPGTCSTACDITDSGLSNVQCNDNGTPSDASDDYITFDLDPQGNGLGTNYIVSGTNFTSAAGLYGAPTSFQTDPGTAGIGDFDLTITDSDDSACTLVFTLVDPGTCSNNCNISSSGLSNIQCNDNGTPGNPNDDYITFDLNPTGNNLGVDYLVSGTPLNPMNANYGGLTSFQTDPGTAGAGDIDLTITDGDNSNCTFIFTLTDPGNCSPECDLTDSGISNIQCHDNGTLSDPSDDYLTFDLNPTGNNLGTSYTLSGTTLTPTNGNYGTTTNFQTSPGTAGGGDLDLTISDDSNAACDLIFTLVDPGSCSSSCVLTQSGFDNLTCNDNGTPYDPSDDYFTFDLDPTGLNLSPNGYEVSSSVNIIPATGTYGSVSTFQTASGTAGNGDLDIIVTDVDNSNCNVTSFLIDPTPNPILLSIEDPTTCGGFGKLNIGGLDANANYFIIYDHLPDTNIVIGALSTNNFGELELFLFEGDYTNFRVQDEVSLCIGGTFDATITDPAAPTLSETHNDPACPNSADGAIDLTVSGGSQNYAFDWDNDGTGDNDDTEDLAGLMAGTYKVTVSDINTGCMDSLSVVIDDTDNTPPTALCLNISVPLDADGLATITPSDIDDGSNDDCGTVSLSIDVNSFNCDSIGIVPVILTVEDEYSNISNCTSTVTIVDDTAPTALCQGTTIQLDGTGMASIAVGDIDNGSFDNCGNISLSLDKTTFNCNDIGSNSVILTVDDGNGNTTDCATAVIVEDNIFPISTCQNVILTLDMTGIATIMPQDVDGGSSDNCGLLTYSVTQDTFTCDHIGMNMVTLTVEDVAGNTDQCNATVVIGENLNPVAICQDISVDLDDDGAVFLQASDIDAGSSDNCDILIFSLNISAFSCDDIGPNVVTLTVEDGNNNSDQCEATVFIQDNQPPLLICQDITVQLSANDTAQITINQIDNGSSDNCGSLNLSLDKDTFDCSTTGTNTVTLSGDDGNGNSSSCTAVVTVQETIAPLAFCQDITVTLDSMGVAVISSSDIDNGSSDNCGIINLSLDINTFGCEDEGINTITLTVTDNSGNSADCTALVNVEKTNVPVVICQDITVNLDQNGNASITAEDIDGGSSDNCGTVNFFIDDDTFTCNNIGPNSVILTGDDGIGNVNQCTAIVTVADVTPPELGCIDITASLGINNSITISPLIIELFSSDNCGTVNLSLDNGSFDCDDIGPNTVNLIADDGNGNSTMCESIITVTENTPPMAVCQNVTVELDQDGNALVDANLVDNGSSDNCGTINLSISNENFDCGDIGANTISLFVNDGNGNSAQCNALVTIIDNAPPLVLTQDITLELDSDGIAMITADSINNSSTDNCGISSLALSMGSFTCDDIGSNLVTLSIEDINGNIGMGQATVTVIDNTSPTVLGQDINVFLDVNGMATIDVDDINNGSFDNCGISNINIDIQNFNCSNIGANTVNMEVIDNNGNSSTFMATVTVLDTIPPEIICPDDNEILTIDCDNVINYEMPIAMDNCSSGSLELIQGLESGSVFPFGPTLNTWQYTDQGGNTIDCSFTITGPDDLSIFDIQIDSLICPEDMDGTITVFPEGGIPNYTYLWNDDQTTQTAVNLGFGDYTVTITDSIGCEIVEMINLPQPSMILITLDSITNDTNMLNTGAIAISVTGGAGNYSYEWYMNNVLISEEEDPMNLAAGAYIVEVTDENGCLVSFDAITVDGVTGTNEPSWASNLSLNPNPTTGRLFLTLPDLNTEIRIEAFDIVGRKVRLEQREITYNQFELNLDHVPSGIYLIQIIALDATVSRKIMVGR